ncbi:50S ribosomal protein L20 [candidate division WOR-3 bacterium]|nr:50S ribosomal protein L20 [candidate division WOR-3 bacterium]
MPRATNNPASKARHKKILELAKGFYGVRHSRFKSANQAVMRAGINAYSDRKKKKRDFRRLWITRISASCQNQGLSYSKFMFGLSKAGIQINRKMIAEIAAKDNEAFSDLVKIAQKSLS